MKRTFGILAFLLFLLSSSCPIFAQGTEDIFIKMHSESEIDAGKLIQDLVDKTIEELKSIANPRELEKINQAQMLLEAMGINTLDKFYSRYDLFGNNAEVNLRLSFKDKEKFLPALLTLPDRDLQIPTYMDPNECMVFLDLTSPREAFQLFSKFLESPSVKSLLGPNTFSISEAVSFLNLDLEKDILPALGEEMAFALLAPDGKSVYPNYVFIAQITAKENLKNLISKFAPSIKPQSSGEFDYYEKSKNFSFAASNQFLVASNNPEKLKKITEGWKAGKEPIKAGLYLHVDIDKIISLALPLIQDNIKMKSNEAKMLEPFKANEYGSITVIKNVEENSLVISASSSRSLVSSLYKTYVSLVPLLAKEVMLKERERRVEKEARSNAYAIKNALESYYISQKTFPSGIEVLLKKGLLHTLTNPYTEKPVQFVPLGKRFPGNFSYVPVKNKKGIVYGFYLMEYGSPDKPGKDIYGPNDLKNLKNFKPVPDGIPDGILIMEKIYK